MSDQASAEITRSWRVPNDRAETRLDTFVRHCLPHLSRREVENAIHGKLFRINDKVGEKGDKLLPGDRVTFKGVGHWLLTAPVSQSQLRVPIVYEDASVLVVDKPAGMAMHGFSGRDQGTLANFLAAERPDLLMIGKSRWEPGLIHRLDRETSGLVLVAKTQAAFDDLRLQFRRRQVRKKYWALVWGITEAEGVVAYPMAHDSRDKRRMRAISDISARSKEAKSWPALTRFRKLWDVDGLSLLEIEMETGVTHQIRVHLAAIGHSIVGDFLYGREGCESFGLKRHFLHAHGLEFFHPRNHRVVKIESDLPLELKDVLGHLKPRR
ncbi:MAG TPA: RluA family pseudouridine synthase [Candidatus Binatia bacterium]|nr:RluA family pseudouridine synthase [Candidatus Binatia bacterium]